MSRTRKPRSIPATEYGLYLLQQARAKSDLSIEEIAARADRSDSTVKRFFAGIPVEPSTASKIVAALDLRLEDIVELEQHIVRDSIVEDLEEEIRTHKETIAAKNREIEQLQAQGNVSVLEIKRLEGEKADVGMKVKLSEENIYAVQEYATKFEARMSISNLIAEWLRIHRESLVEEAVEFVWSKNFIIEELGVPVDFLDKLKQQFWQDIKKCLKLVYHCLQLGSHNLLYKAIMQKKITPNLKKTAYVEVFKFIKEQKAAKELPVEMAKELAYYLDLLATLLPTLS